MSGLCLKAGAIIRRDKPKDAYDAAWLTDGLGPDQASEAIAASPIQNGQSATEVVTQIGRMFDDQFRDIEWFGPVVYADFLEAQPQDGELRHACGSIAALSQLQAT